MSSAAAGIFSLNVGRRFEGEIKSYALARSAIPYVQKLLEDDETPKHDGEGEAIFKSKEFYETQTLGEGVFEISCEYPNSVTGYPEKSQGIIDEERKLNLNTANTDTLTMLFQSRINFEDFEEKALPFLVASIEDWRDTDNDRREGGAEKFEYMVLKKPYECKNGPFESLEELLLVKGMTPQIYKRVAPYLTVYSSGKVNLNTAIAPVLLALGFSESGVSGMMAFRIGQDGQIGTEDDGVIVNIQAIAAELGAFLPAEDGNKVARLLKEGSISVDSSTFSFTAEGRSDSYAYPYKIDVVMNRDGEVLSWREA